MIAKGEFHPDIVRRRKTRLAKIFKPENIEILADGTYIGSTRIEESDIEAFYEMKQKQANNTAQGTV